MALGISSDMLKELQGLALRGAPLEICGLLFGENGRVSGFAETLNVAENRQRHFEIDPAALIAAERAAREDGPAIIGYFHSHPASNVLPSKTDAESAAPDGRYWLIINGREAAAWTASENGELFGRFDPIALDCH